MLFSSKIPPARQRKCRARERGHCLINGLEPAKRCNPPHRRSSVVCLVLINCFRCSLPDRSLARSPARPPWSSLSSGSSSLSRFFLSPSLPLLLLVKERRGGHRWVSESPSCSASVLTFDLSAGLWSRRGCSSPVLAERLWEVRWVWLLTNFVWNENLFSPWICVWPLLCFHLVFSI